MRRPFGEPRLRLDGWPTWAGLAMALVLTSAALGQDPGSLRRYIPRDDLVALGEYQGIDAHADAWKKTAAFQVLNETRTGAMLESLGGQLADVVLSQMDHRTIDGTEFVKLAKSVFHNGMVVALNGRPGGDAPPVVTVVLRGAARPEVHEPFERLIRALIPRGAQTQILTRQDGRRLIVVRTGDESKGWVFWSENEDWVVSVGRAEDGAEVTIATLEGKRPNAGELPILTELSQRDGDFEPVAIGLLDLSVMPPTPPTLGLDGAKRVDYRGGFSGNALMSVTRLFAPSPRQGLLALIDQPPITKETVPPLPKGLSAYTVLSMDLGKLYDTVVSQLKALNPNAATAIDQVNEAFQRQTGVKLRDDVLAQVGPRMAFYGRPEMVKAPLTPIGGMLSWLFHMPPLVAELEIQDPGAFRKTLDGLVNTGNNLLASAGPPGEAPSLVPTERNSYRGYRLEVPAQLVPLPSTIRPGLLLGTRHLALSTTLTAARQALDLEAKPENGLTIEPELLRDGLIVLNVSDPRDLMPDLLANLPFLVQMMGRMGPDGPFGRRPGSSENPLSVVRIDPERVPSSQEIAEKLFPGSVTVAVDEQGLTIISREAIPSYNPMTAWSSAVALLLPAVSSARQAAQRAQSVNNLKQIGLAMHNYHATYNEFPAEAICDKAGKPLLSWRVAILPFIEQQELYNEFHLDEPWDSPHNKPLLDKMPAVYRSTRNQPNDPNSTFYQVFVGKGALFNKAEGVQLQTITDGTSNTIMAFEAGKAVPWSKPEDIEYDPEKPLPMFGGPGFAGGFNAAFADGSVHFLSNSIDKMVLHALITRAGGEVIGAGEF